MCLALIAQVLHLIECLLLETRSRSLHFVIWSDPTRRISSIIDWPSQTSIHNSIQEILRDRWKVAFHHSTLSHFYSTIANAQHQRWGTYWPSMLIGVPFLAGKSCGGGIIGEMSPSIASTSENKSSSTTGCPGRGMISGQLIGMIARLPKLGWTLGISPICERWPVLSQLILGVLWETVGSTQIGLASGEAM